MKSIEVKAPDGYEIDQGNSTFEKIVFKKLPKNNPSTLPEYAHFWVSPVGEVLKNVNTLSSRLLDTGSGAETEAQARLMLDQRLAIVECRRELDKLRGSYVPDWSDRAQSKYSLFYNYSSTQFSIISSSYTRDREDFWYLRKQSDVREFIRTMDGRTLYLAMFGEYYVRPC